MASYTVARAKHATLAANTVDTVTFTLEHANVEILNRSAVDYLYARTDGTAPTVAGDDCDAIPPGGAGLFPLREQTVKIISSGSAAAYSVTGI